jgi:small GTP-binding protein
MDNSIGHILHDHIFKIMLIGYTSCGKTSMCMRYVNSSYTDLMSTTVGLDFFIKKINYNDLKIKLQIWDTAGMERYKSITKSYCRNQDQIIIMYDVTDLYSFSDAKNWIDIILEMYPSNIVILVGNKIDIKSKIKISTEEGMELAKNNNILFFECSVKNNINIDNIFIKAIKNMIKNKKIEVPVPKLQLEEIKLDESESKSQEIKMKCCS